MKKKTQTLIINIYNLGKNKICDELKTKQLVRYVIKKEDYKDLFTLNIIIADGKYLKRLNKKFFNKNKTTNVISFNLDGVGEIYISRDEVNFPVDFYYYLIHGLLHILGYDHYNKKTEQVMDHRCRLYLKDFSIL